MAWPPFVCFNWNRGDHSDTRTAVPWHCANQQLQRVRMVSNDTLTRCDATSHGVSAWYGWLDPLKQTAYLLISVQQGNLNDWCWSEKICCFCKPDQVWLNPMSNNCCRNIDAASGRQLCPAGDQGPLHPWWTSPNSAGTFLQHVLFFSKWYIFTHTHTYIYNICIEMFPHDCYSLLAAWWTLTIHLMPLSRRMLNPSWQIPADTCSPNRWSWLLKPPESGTPLLGAPL